MTYRRLGALVASVSIAVSLAVLPGPAGAVEERTGQQSTSAKPATGPLERADAVSAAATAKLENERVEDLSQRTESQQVFANPDGTWTAELAAGPVRVQDADGEWHDIDTTLAEKDGVIAPAHAMGDLEISPGGDEVMASMVVDGHRMAWLWPIELPSPEIEGDTATYKDALPGLGDLVIEATATGFSHHLVLPERPSGPVELPVPVLVSADDSAASTQVADGLAATGADENSTTLSDDKARETRLQSDAAGGLKIVAGSGETLLQAPRPTMWDSSKNEAGDPKVAELDVAVPAAENVASKQARESGSRAAAAGRGAVELGMTLTADQAFSG